MIPINIESALDIVKFLEANNGKLIINIETSAVGHTLSELDNFMCMRVLGEVPADGICCYIGPDEERMSTISELYGDSLNIVFFLSKYASEMARSIALFRPDLTVDVGMSSFKIAPIENETLRSEQVDHIIYRSSINKLMGDFVSYYRRKLEAFTTEQTRFLFPMPGGMLRKFIMPDELERLVDARGRRLALIQIKDTEQHSGGAEAVDPLTYVPTLEYLKDMNFQLVQVGREYHPKDFARLGVIDYANSPLASFKNDFALFSNSDFCLTGPSGIAMFPELMMKPYVVANTWWHGIPPFSPLAVALPALARLRENNLMLTFAEQNELYFENGVYFPLETHESVSPDGTDILAATIEALGLEENLTLLNERQIQYRQMATPKNQADLCNPYCLSRLSSAYAERYQNLLSPK